MARRWETARVRPGCDKIGPVHPSARTACACHFCVDFVVSFIFFSLFLSLVLVRSGWNDLERAAVLRSGAAWARLDATPGPNSKCDNIRIVQYCGRTRSRGPNEPKRNRTRNRNRNDNCRCKCDCNCNCDHDPSTAIATVNWTGARLGGLMVRRRAEGRGTRARGSVRGRS